jgi:integrase/recombinase XerD
MTALKQHLNDYLTIRHGLGFKLVTEQRVLRRFVAFMDDAGEPSITVALALRWVRIPTGVGHAYLAQRMRAVRGFARYMHGIDPATEVPPLALLPARKHRPTPHIYTATEVASMMTAAQQLLPPLRAATMETLIGLLACTGIRDSEAFALDRTDIDRVNGLLRIRDSKYGKSREVLIHDTTIATLDAYLARRDQLRTGGDHTCVFVSCWGARLSHKSVHRSFGQIRQASGVSMSASGRRPRLHDFRHTFAVNTLLGWYQGGDDVAAKLPLLSTYLGHVDPAATYWYLSAVPELLALAARRLEQRDNDDAASDREVAMLLREQERIRHWRTARARRAGR